MFENSEKVIRECGILYIEEERYGSMLLAGFDFDYYKCYRYGRCYRCLYENRSKRGYI